MRLSKTKQVHLTSKAKKLLTSRDKIFPALMAIAFICIGLQIYLSGLKDANQLTWQVITQILLIVLSGLSAGGIFALYAFYEMYNDEAKQKGFGFIIKAMLLIILIGLSLILTLLL